MPPLSLLVRVSAATHQILITLTFVFVLCVPAAKPAGAYRPPHARNSALPDMFKREDQGGQRWTSPSLNGTSSPGGTRSLGQQSVGGRARTIPGAAGPPGSAPPTPSQDGQGSRRNRNKKQDGGSQNNNNNNKSANGSSAGASSAPAPAANGASPFAAEVNTSALSPEDKKRRAVLKKLGAIEALKDRLAAGEQLEKTQVKKIESEAELRKELAAIG